MDITLPKALEAFVKEQVASGKYGSSSEVHGEALRLLMTWQGRATERDILRGEIDKGIAEADRGAARACTPEDIVQLASKRKLNPVDS